VLPTFHMEISSYAMTPAGSDIELPGTPSKCREKKQHWYCCCGIARLVVLGAVVALALVGCARLQRSSAAPSTADSGPSSSTSLETMLAYQAARFNPASLFCFSLMLPWGPERKLIQWQLTHEKSIFACNEWAVYSNATLELGGSVSTRVVHTNLECPIGGKWHTRLNTPIFIKLWKQVFQDGQFRLAAWTAKVDPDAVFVASRLRGVVATTALAKAQEGRGMFFDNCEYKQSLHGALEVLSRKALEVYGDESKDKCDARIMQEDVYLRSCLLYKLKVANFQGDWKILAEEYCYWDWKTCQNDHVAFHPFKTLEAYKECLTSAEEHSTAQLLL